jgi:hypothetical protein
VQKAIMGQLIQAEDMLNRALNMVPRTKNVDFVAQVMSDLSMVYQQQGEEDQAQQTFQNMKNMICDVSLEKPPICYSKYLTAVSSLVLDNETMTTYCETKVETNGLDTGHVVEAIFENHGAQFVKSVTLVSRNETLVIRTPSFLPLSEKYFEVTIVVYGDSFKENKLGVYRLLCRNSLNK